MQVAPHQIVSTNAKMPEKKSERDSAIEIAAATGTKANYGDDAIGAIMAKARRRAPS